MPQIYLPNEDTITAVATPIGEGGIAVVRISGKDAVGILEKIFKRTGEGAVKDMSSHRLYRGYIVEPESGIRVDDVLAVLMKSPHSYTGEDVVEIHSHGGYIVPKRIVDLAIHAGARLAAPGEFSLRAFLNGRMDLAQAEAVVDVVNAQTEESLRWAELQLQGVLSKEIGEIKDKVIDILAEVEANVDFPEEGIDPIALDNMRKRALEACEGISRLLDTYEEGRILKYGVYTAIVGKPNVGKSSLLNSLLMKERAIVSPYPGTTRDFIEESIDVRGIPLKIVDTAGMRATVDEVEKVGVEFAKKKAEEAELIIAVLDGSLPIDEDDIEILRGLDGRKSIVAINKSDLPQVVSEEALYDWIPGERIVKTSARMGWGIEELKDRIYKLLLGKRKRLEGTEVIIGELRHKVSLEKAREGLLNFLNALYIGESPEFLSIDLRYVLDALGEITGETTTEDILDRVFSRFCIGK